MTLTKRDLVLRICEDTDLVQQHVFDIVQRTLDHVIKALAKGEKVELRNFGIFEIRVRRARTGRNPSAPGIEVPIPERCVVKFKAGREMRLEVGKLAPKLAAKPATQPPKA
jgi:nucleoid DNA-binding protein